MFSAHLEARTSFLRPNRSTLTIGIATFVFLAIAVFNPMQVKTALAAANDGIGAYFSPPFVQGPPASANASILSFNNQAAGTCDLTSINTNSPVGTFALTGSTSGQTNPCRIVNGATNVWGGANTTTDTPTVNSPGTPYLSAPDCNTSPCSQSLVLTLPAGVKYVGFWWSAGNPGNRVRFYTSADPNNPIATYTTNTLDSILGPDNPSPYPGTAKVTAIDGTEYLKNRYFGRPADVTSLTTSSISALNNKQSHAYINLYASGTVQFSKIEFNGAGFEMDNIAVSSSPGSVASNLVFLEGVLGETVQFKANGGSGTMATQTSTTATTLTSNAFTRPNFQFAGWNTSSTGTGGTSYTDINSYPFTASTTLYAQWTPVLNVTYDEHGGTTVTDGTFLPGDTITLPPAPSQTGQRFNGWFTAPTGGTPLGTTYTPTGNTNITLHAQWSALAVTTSPQTTAPATTTPTASPTTVAQSSATTPTSKLPTTGKKGSGLSMLAFYIAFFGLVIMLVRDRFRTI